jgi:hypothetical protein
LRYIKKLFQKTSGMQVSSMDLYEAMSTLRAVRRLKPDPISDDVQARILNAATWAPTGGNVQPWRMVAVTDADKKQVLEDLYRPHWEGYTLGYESKMEEMPEDWYTCAHVPVGYPVLGGHGSINRRGIDEMVSFNSWR